MVIFLLIVDAEGDCGKTGDGDVAKPLLLGLRDIRVQRVAEAGLYQGEGALDAPRQIPLLRRQPGQDAVLDREDSVVDLPG